MEGINHQPIDLKLLTEAMIETIDNTKQYLIMSHSQKPYTITLNHLKKTIKQNDAISNDIVLCLLNCALKQYYNTHNTRSTIKDRLICRFIGHKWLFDNQIELISYCARCHKPQCTVGYIYLADFIKYQLIEGKK